jgi:hypothetical protein
MSMARVCRPGTDGGDRRANVDVGIGDGTSGGVGVVFRFFIHAMVVVNYLAGVTRIAVEG